MDGAELIMTWVRVTNWLNHDLNGYTRHFNIMLFGFFKSKSGYILTMVRFNQCGWLWLVLRIRISVVVVTD